eukprot:CAMPEP_0197940640 /NCGR_PEP_ID=MMETSP1439-20131203/121597_1 /TAXON_ID=66791 /ORGANISM="Gonyaulax spinifera, Strain CCMP409" /LENGTH=68 /DNA_ID=CAMNT_0043563819 /DNA_START=45 /DNA_END=248 /DNA_ORIENTATION=+
MPMRTFSTRGSGKERNSVTTRHGWETGARLWRTSRRGRLGTATRPADLARLGINVRPGHGRGRGVNPN